jgi:hypothetical protein
MIYSLELPTDMTSETREERMNGLRSKHSEEEIIIREMRAGGLSDTAWKRKAKEELKNQMVKKL